MAGYGQRLRYNFITGTITGISSGNIITFSTNAPFGSATITSGQQYLPLVINPSTYGVSNSSEIVYVYSYTGGNTATVARAQEGTTNGGNWANGTVYSHGPTVFDFDVSNLTSSGTLTLTSGLNVTNGNITNSGQLTTTTISVTNNANVGGSINSSSLSNISAAGTNQTSATSVTTQYTVVSGGTTATSNGGTGTGIVLPSISTVGQKLLIDNSTNNWLLIYPATGQSIDNTTGAVWLAPSAYWEGYAETTTSWASFVASFNADSTNTVNVAYGNGQITFGVNPSSNVTVSGLTVKGNSSISGSLTVSSGITPYGYTPTSAALYGTYTGQPVLTQFGYYSGTTNSYGQALITFPTSFPNGVLNIVFLNSSNNIATSQYMVGIVNGVSSTTPTASIWAEFLYNTSGSFLPHINATASVYYIVYGF
jgi:hypothetical protein